MATTRKKRGHAHSQRAALAAMLAHPAHGEVRFSARSRSFKRQRRTAAGVRSATVPGLMPTLSAAFWPDYEYAPPPARYRCATGVRSAREGMARGTLVHRQLEHYANDDDAQWRRRRKRRRLHPYAQKAVLAMREWGWTPVIAELTVYDPELEMATRLDMLCLDAQERAVLVEWKCGMDNYMCRGSAPMRGPLRALYSNAPLNQALVQLMFTRSFLHRTYGLQPAEAYVVQIREDGIVPYALPARMLHAEQACRTYVRACVERKKSAAAQKRKRKAG